MTNLPNDSAHSSALPDPFASASNEALASEEPLFPSGEPAEREVTGGEQFEVPVIAPNNSITETVSTEKKPAAKKTSSRSTGLAFAGEPVDLDELKKIAEKPSAASFPSWSTSRIYDAGPKAPDFEDVSDLNKSVQQVRSAISRVTNGLEIANRDVTLAEIEYRKAHAFAIIGVSGGTVGQREAFADLKVQTHYDDLQVKKAIANELSQRMRSLKFDLDGLQIIANNMRAEINLR